MITDIIYSNPIAPNEFADPKPLISKMEESQIEQLKEYIGKLEKEYSGKTEDQREPIDPVAIKYFQTKFGISDLIKRIEALESIHKEIETKVIDKLHEIMEEAVETQDERIKIFHMDLWNYISKMADKLDYLEDQLAAKRSSWSKFKDWMLKKGFWINTDFKD
jgi:uncharacterized protein (UPF0210 family)